MLVSGYFLATYFTDLIGAYGPFIAFGLLSVLGIKMIVSGIKNPETCPVISTAPLQIIPFALATSVDALAIGASFAFLHVDIISAASIVGMTTFILSVLGTAIGCTCGTKLQSKANLAGGIILLFIGIRMLAV